MPALWNSAPLTPQQATVNPCLCQELLDTHKQVWLNLLWGHCPFLLAPGVHKVLFVPSKSLFPQFCGNSVIKYHWPPTSNSLRVLSHFSGSPGWGICCESQFLTAQAFLLHNCSAVHALSARLLYVWADGDLLQEGLCHMLRVPHRLRPEPLSSQRACLLSMRAPSTGAARQSQVTVIVNKDSKMVLACMCSHGRMSSQKQLSQCLCP